VFLVHSHQETSPVSIPHADEGVTTWCASSRLAQRPLPRDQAASGDVGEQRHRMLRRLLASALFFRYPTQAPCHCVHGPDVSAESHGGGAMSKGTVLVVDDDAAIRDLVKTALEEEGYTVSVCTSGAALRQVQARQAELILLDLTLVEVVGGATVERLRADPATAHIPLIGFSARHDRAALAARMQLDGLLPKPFDLDDLYALVACWVAEGRQCALAPC